MSQSQAAEALSPRERRAARTRQAILDAARELINERGAHNLSLREVARRIDYSPAGLYEYFANKDDIITGVLNDGFERFGQYLMAVPTDLEPQAYLLELGLAYIRFARQNPEHFMLIFNSPELCRPHSPETSNRVYEGTFGALQGGIQRCLAAGLINPRHHRDDLAQAAWALVHGMSTLLITQVHDRDRLDRWETVSREMMNAWMRGLQ